MTLSAEGWNGELAPRGALADKRDHLYREESGRGKRRESEEDKPVAITSADLI